MIFDDQGLVAAVRPGHTLDSRARETTKALGYLQPTLLPSLVDEPLQERNS
jgi:hypothetical protein